MRTAALALPLLLAALLGGCSDSEEAYFSVFVQDAPTDEFRSVFVNFTEVSVHQSGGNGTSGWRTVFSDADGITVDLLNVTGTRAAFLGEATLRPGHYQQLRFTAASAYGILVDGTRVEIDVPDKSPLRTSKSFRLEAGKETQLVLDIDLDKSLVQKGGEWELKAKIGKVVASIQEREAKPAKGEATEVNLADDAA